MPYSQGRIVHDADAHIMETPTWLHDPRGSRLPGQRLPSCAIPGGNELRQTGDPSDQRRDLAAVVRGSPRPGTPRPSTGPTNRPRSSRAEGPRRQPGSSLPRTAGRALDLLGFSSQLVFNTFHNSRLHDMEHADADLAYATARAHNRGMLEFCSADRRLLPSLYIPLADPARAIAATEDALAQGAAALFGGHDLHPRTLGQPHRPVQACRPGQRRPASPSCSTSAARPPPSTPTTSSTASPCRQTSTAARRTSVPWLHGDPGPAGPDLGHADLRRRAGEDFPTCTSV